MPVRSSIVCERVRAQVSLELDDELSELERRMLAAHLERCDECCSFADEVGALTQSIRQAPALVLESPIVVRRRRRVSLTAAPIGVAASLAIAVVGVASQLGALDPQRPATTSAATSRSLFQAAWRPEQEIAQIAVVDKKVRPDQRPGPLSAL